MADDPVSSVPALGIAKAAAKGQRDGKQPRRGGTRFAG